MRKPCISLLSVAILLAGCAGRGEDEQREAPQQPNQQAGGSSTATVALPNWGSSGGALGGIGMGIGGSLNLSGEVEPQAPIASRECIAAALERGTGASAGAPSQPSSPVDAAGASGASGMNPTATDLGLGAGDLTVLVLFDQSGSMASGWDERSKWQVANQSLMSALDPVLDLVTIGTIFFPQPGECNVAAIDSGLQIGFMSGRNFRTHWEATAASRGPNGSTPLGLAMQVADMAIERACQLGLLERRFRVVIVTDGEPNCGVDVETLPLLPAQWRRLGIETRVMGLPGSQGALDLMDRIAQAGGTDRCLSLGSPQQMGSEMQQALL